MNRDKILNTPAGPELDALVAEVLGWKRCRGSGMFPPVYWVNPEGRMYYDLPPWSTDIGAADELIKLCATFRLLNWGKWDCDLGLAGGGEGEIESQLTHTEAIASAFLLAKQE